MPVRSPVHWVVSPQLRFEPRNEKLWLRAVKMSLLSFLSFSHSCSAGEEEEAGIISFLDAFAPSNGCGSLLGVSLFTSLINRGFFSAAANTADFSSGGPATAEEACSEAV